MLYMLYMLEVQKFMLKWISVDLMYPCMHNSPGVRLAFLPMYL